MTAWWKENRDSALVIIGGLVYFGLALLGRQ